MRRLLILVIALMLVGVQIPAALAQDATPSPGGGVESLVEQIQGGEICAWPVTVDVEDGLNVGFPDEHSFYFIVPYVLSPGQSIVVEGTYPSARFFSLVTYYRDVSSDTGLELLGWLPDYAIAPEAGSTNPAVDPNASTDPAQRQWTVEVTGTGSPSDTPMPATPVEGQNVLPGMPADIENTIGVLALRIYVPQESVDHTGGVGLPTLTFVDESGDNRTLGECTTEERDTWQGLFLPFYSHVIEVAPALPLPPSADAQPEWVHNDFPGVGTNPDNRYLMAPIAWEPDRIAVIRGQAPTFPDTRAGESPAMPADMRYWSFCTGSNVVPLVTVSCISDFEMPIDADGMYTVVLSQPEYRPANATEEDGVAWMQAGDAAQPELFFLRHMLPSDDFHDQSVWAVPEEEAGVAEDIMGPYYPQITYCDVATFEDGGADACFAAGDAATPAG